METYEQKLKLAKEALESGSYDKETIEYIFPELKENENERIRKWLYDYISNCPNNNFEFYGGVGKDTVLNYLEKQKEQKPAEWSEKDEVMRDNILRLLSYFVGTVECDSNPSISTSYPVYQKEIDWLKSLRPQPQHLPSNFDEATKKYCSHITKEGIILTDEDAIRGFIMGAKWMAEQGVSYTDKIYNWSDDNKSDGVDENKFTLDGFGEEEALSRGVKQGLFKVQDKVIVQIRKAE